MPGLRVTLTSVHAPDREATSPEEEWVERCLTLAYLPDEASPEMFIEGVRVVGGLRVGEGDDPTLGGRRVRGIIRRVLANYPRKKRLIPPPPPGPLPDVLASTAVEIDAHRSLALKVELLVGSEEAVERLLPVFLDDPRLGIGKRLRSCALESCGRVFISRASRLGGPRRKYCCDDHREKADRADAVYRVARKRSADKRAAKHK